MNGTIITPESAAIIGDTCADVIWWSSKAVRLLCSRGLLSTADPSPLLPLQAAVRCPYCQEEHVHSNDEGLAQLLESSPSLVPPCLKPDARAYYPPYKLKFPEHTVIDRKGWRFVTGTALPQNAETRHLITDMIEGEEIHRDTVLEDL